MPMYKIKANAELKRLPKSKFVNETQMKAITEANLLNLMQAYFIADEYQIENRRIDTLAYNDETQSFIIIEYKNCKNDKAVDQSIAYWNLLQNHHQEIIELFNLWLTKNQIEPIQEHDINWHKCKIAVIAPSFNHEQIEAFSYDERIDLYIMYTLDQNQMVYFRQLPNRKPIKQANLKHALTPSPVILPKTVIEKAKQQIETAKQQKLKATATKNANTADEIIQNIMNYFILADDQFKIETKKMQFNDNDNDNDQKIINSVYQISWNHINGAIIRIKNEQVYFYLIDELANQKNINFHNLNQINGMYNQKPQTYYETQIETIDGIQIIMINLKIAVNYYVKNHQY